MGKTLKTITVKRPKTRNPFAVEAKQRRAGRHSDRRKEGSRKACRRGGWNE